MTLAEKVLQVLKSETEHETMVKQITELCKEEIYAQNAKTKGSKCNRVTLMKRVFNKHIRAPFKKVQRYKDYYVFTDSVFACVFKDSNVPEHLVAIEDVEKINCNRVVEDMILNNKGIEHAIAHYGDIKSALQLANKKEKYVRVQVGCNDYNARELEIMFKFYGVTDLELKGSKGKPNYGYVDKDNFYVICPMRPEK